MFDLRPVGYVAGLLIAILGASMALPLAADLYFGSDQWPEFAAAGFISVFVGGSMALATANTVKGDLNLRQTFLMTSAVWLLLPVFGAIPFVIGATHATWTDAFFEAMSGLTTTGATTFSGLDTLPPGLQLWRSMLQWFGGVGIIVVSMVFLPTLRVGGMQIFRSEGFDTFGKILPRAAQIAQQISLIYVGLTAACALSYLLVGLGPWDAVNHALTTVSTGGYSTHDASFGAFKGAPEYAAVLFMIGGALPFVRYVQLVNGSALPMWRDSQVRAFIALLLTCVAVMVAFRLIANGDALEPALREGLFNVTSIMTGTGYASADYQVWGGFPVVFFFFLGLIGGCAGSTACSVKVFRYQLLIASVRAQVGRIYSPRGIFIARYEGKPVPEDVLSSVMAFFMLFFVTLAAATVLLSLTGLDLVTSLSGAASAIANIGPGLGDVIGPAGTYGTLNDPAKWILAITMLAGRLELMTFFILFTPRFWRS